MLGNVGGCRQQLQGLMSSARLLEVNNRFRYSPEPNCVVTWLPGRQALTTSILHLRPKMLTCELKLDEYMSLETVKIALYALVI